MRATFSKTLENLAEKDPNILLLTADLGRFFSSFQKKLPKQFVNCGVAEENMLGLAAGLSLSGRNIYCYSIIPFLIMRTLESIRVNICYNKLKVKLLGAGGGLVYGREGMTHQAIEDIGIMRSLPNMTIVAPADLSEVKALAEESVDFSGPLYIRFGRDKAPAVYPEGTKFRIGKGIVLSQGEKIALLSAGTLLAEAKRAEEKLAGQGVRISLISMSTIKPLDSELIREIAENHSQIFVLEDHSQINGLGSAVNEALNEFNYKGSLKKLALPDSYSDFVGSPDYLYRCYGLDSDSVAEKIYESAFR